DTGRTELLSFLFTSSDCSGTPYMSPAMNGGWGAPGWLYEDGAGDTILLTGNALIPSLSTQSVIWTTGSTCVLEAHSENVFAGTYVTIAHYPFAAPMKTELR